MKTLTCLRLVQLGGRTTKTLHHSTLLFDFQQRQKSTKTLPRPYLYPPVETRYRAFSRFSRFPDFFEKAGKKEKPQTINRPLLPCFKLDKETWSLSRNQISSVVLFYNSIQINLSRGSKAIIQTYQLWQFIIKSADRQTKNSWQREPRNSVFAPFYMIQNHPNQKNHKLTMFARSFTSNKRVPSLMFVSTNHYKWWQLLSSNHEINQTWRWEKDEEPKFDSKNLGQIGFASKISARIIQKLRENRTVNSTANLGHLGFSFKNHWQFRNVSVGTRFSHTKKASFKTALDLTKQRDEGLHRPISRYGSVSTNLPQTPKNVVYLNNFASRHSKAKFIQKFENSGFSKGWQGPNVLWYSFISAGSVFLSLPTQPSQAEILTVVKKKQDFSRNEADYADSFQPGPGFPRSIQPGLGSSGLFHVKQNRNFIGWTSKHGAKTARNKRVGLPNLSSFAKDSVSRFIGHEWKRTLPSGPIFGSGENLNRYIPLRPLWWNDGQSLLFLVPLESPAHSYFESGRQVGPGVNLLSFRSGTQK